MVLEGTRYHGQVSDGCTGRLGTGEGGYILGVVIFLANLLLFFPLPSNQRNQTYRHQAGEYLEYLVR
jgi:hypothetical protein